MNSAGQPHADDLIIVARTVKTRGLKGELVADVLTDFPDRFEHVSSLTALGSGGDRKELLLESYWFQNDRVVLKFDGYDSVESASSLVGYDLGLPEAQRVQLSEDEFYDWELEGCSVETRDGQAVGVVQEVMRTGGVELLVVEGGSGKQILIPLARSIVVELDTANKRILIDPPEGLLEL